MERRYTIKELHLVMNQNEANDKLCQLEDIEEELNINLSTLFKALKNGIWAYDEHGTKIYYNRITIEKYGIIAYKHGIVRDEPYFTATFEGYGKIWALTKEELE